MSGANFSGGSAALSYQIIKNEPTNISSNNNEPENTGDSYDNSTFSIVEGEYSWEEARVDAESRGGRMAVLDSTQKIEKANNFLLNNNSLISLANSYQLVSPPSLQWRILVSSKSS